jgi:guanylate kinase
LVNSIVSRVPELKYAVSYTTRQRRDNEAEGRDYFFVSPSQFELMRARGELIEWAEVYGCLYGRSRQALEHDLVAGMDVILSIDVQGAASIQKTLPESVSIFVLPPAFSVLSERLTARRTDLDSAVEQRLEIASQEVRRYAEYDYIVINGGLDEALVALEAIIIAERHRQDRMQQQVQTVIETFL